MTDTNNSECIQNVPVLPLRDIVVFPQMVVPLYVGRERSIRALDEAMDGTRDVLLVAQRRAKDNNPKPDDLFQIGTLASILHLLRLPDGTVKVLVEGKVRASVVQYHDEDELLTVDLSPLQQDDPASVETEALLRSLKTTFATYVKLNKRIPPEMLVSVQTIVEPSKLADTIAAHLQLKLEDKQELLECTDPMVCMQRLLELMQAEIEILQVEKRIRSRVKRQMEKSQKEYYLTEQMQAIQKELGERDELKGEIQELEAKIAALNVSEEAREKLARELRRLRMMAPMSAEATVVRNYIEWVIDLPWDSATEATLDMARAEAILEEDHHGLEKVKERILEYLAVESLVSKMSGPILCFVGPPGVGKTSLGRSIARATGRNFVRLSLGGVRDEAEIRGHRRTYIGAMPGKIIQQLRKAGSSNPVFLLDEVDKMSTDFRGDPAAALLEVLDPEQNASFNDHYLDLDYDLSDVMFITTANNLHDIPLPLQDRMEVIRLAGYTDEEKLQIARRYLIPRQLKLTGVDGSGVAITGGALRRIVSEYTREAGVRNLEREIASVCRKIARKVVRGAPKKSTFRVAAGTVPGYLGVPRFNTSPRDKGEEIGLASGLAVTQVGGELLETEVTVLPGRGKLVLTGKLGDVMQESAQAALSYVRSRSVSFGLDPQFYQKVDIHVHLPEGAIPKDGPSAGITIAAAMVSSLLQVPLRRDVAMTGEITLRGRVLPIGGLKEKLLAAHRNDIGVVLIPEGNVKDLEDIPMKIRRRLEIRAVGHMDEVVRAALRLAEPEAFLPGRSTAMDWRVSQDSPSPSSH